MSLQPNPTPTPMDDIPTDVLLWMFDILLDAVDNAPSLAHRKIAYATAATFSKFISERPTWPPFPHSN